LGILAALWRGRCLLPGRRGVFRPRRMFGSIALGAFLLGLRLVLLRLQEHGGGGQQAAEDSQSGNYSRYVHEIRSCRISYRPPETLPSTNMISDLHL
jgi:hypothetical protein